MRFDVKERLGYKYKELTLKVWLGIDGETDVTYIHDTSPVCFLF